MVKIKKSLQILFGMGHLLVIPIYILGICLINSPYSEIGDFIMVKLISFFPMSVHILFWGFNFAFTSPILLIPYLLFLVIFPAVACFTLGRKKIFYGLFVIIPHLLNALVFIAIDGFDMLSMINIAYLVLAIILPFLPEY